LLPADADLSTLDSQMATQRLDQAEWTSEDLWRTLWDKWGGHAYFNCSLIAYLS